MSINRSQAEALADGFLDDIGTSEELQPRETFTELFLLAGELIEDAQDNLNASNSNASGFLSQSIIANEPEEEGSIIRVTVQMATYGQFVNKGVKGTKSGSSTAGYSFKNNFPSRKMIQALMKGVGLAKKSTTNVNRAKTVSGNEKKNIRISDISKAFGAARNIKMYGIKTTGFMDKAITTTEAKVEDRLGKAFKTDIINSL